MRYWLATLLGVAITAAAVAVVAWCTRALVEHSLCTPLNEELACTTEPGALGAAIAVCALVVIPLASVIFMHRTSPRGTALGALGLGLAISAAGGAALYAGIPSDDTTVQIAGIVTGSVLLSIGPFFLIGGMVATGRRLSPAAAAAARTASAAAAARPTTGAASGAVFLSGGDARARSTAGPAPDLAKQGFGQLAAMLSQVADEVRRASESSRRPGGS